MDVNTAPAESSPAAVAVAVPTDPAAYAEWRQSGKVPEPKPEPKPEESAPSKESSDEGQQDTAKPADSEPARKQEHKPNSAEQRLRELLADLKTAGLSPAELKTFKREAQKAAEDKPKAAPEQTEKPAKPEPPKRPKQEDFDTWEKYEEARDKYYEDLADFKAQKAVESYREQQRKEAQDREMRESLSAAAKKYGDGSDQVITGTATQIWSDDRIAMPVKAMIGESDVMADVLYTLGTGEDLQEFMEQARTNPGAAIRKVVLLERLIKEELAKGGGDKPATLARDESGKFAKAESAPEKKTTEAPPPVKEVGGRSAAPPDEVESAFKAGDFARFQEARNRKDLARR